MSSLSTRTRLLQSEDRQRWDELWAQYLKFYEQNLPQSITDLTWQRLMDRRELFGFAALDHDERVIGFVHYHFHLSTWSPAGLSGTSVCLEYTVGAV